MIPILFNWGRDNKKLGNIQINYCEHCKNIAVYEAHEVNRNAGVFFIKLAKWSKKYYITCPICHYGFEVETEKCNELLAKGINVPDQKDMVAIWNILQEMAGKEECRKFLEQIEAGKGVGADKTIEKWSDAFVDRVSEKGFHPEKVKNVFSVWFMTFIASIKNSYEQAQNSLK